MPVERAPSAVLCVGLNSGEAKVLFGPLEGLSGRSWGKGKAVEGNCWLGEGKRGGGAG